VIEFRLESFEGPLDLLLRLIEKNKIDICDIPVSQLTEQYMEVIRTFAGEPHRGMDAMSEFLVMAATLLEIKSRMLLPKPPAQDGEGDEDPRDALVRKLLAYKQCQALAEQLKFTEDQGKRITREGERELFAELSRVEPLRAMAGVAADELWRVFTEVMKRRALRTDPVRAGYGDMPRERFTVEEKIALIAEQLVSGNGKLRLRALFEACETRIEMVITFLAMLELIRRGQARASQRRVFGEIYLAV
jgi:segregation and condensation protein A